MKCVNIDDGKGYIQIELNKETIDNIQSIQNKEEIERKIRDCIKEHFFGYKKEIKFQID